MQLIRVARFLSLLSNEIITLESAVNFKVKAFMTDDSSPTFYLSTSYDSSITFQIEICSMFLLPTICIIDKEIEESQTMDISWFKVGLAFV